MTPYVKSEARPEGDRNTEHPHVTKIVASSFDEIVLKTTKDVLVYVYADCMCTHLSYIENFFSSKFICIGCGPCLVLIPIYDLLAHVFSDNTNVVISKIDFQRNDIDKKYFFEDHIPNIKFFPGNDKVPHEHTTRTHSRARTRMHVYIGFK